MKERSQPPRPGTSPLEIDREPDYYPDKTPCWRLADGRTVIGKGRRQIVIMPPVYVPVPAAEQEKWEKDLVDALVNLLKTKFERRAAEAAGVPYPYERPKRKRRGRRSGESDVVQSP